LDPFETLGVSPRATREQIRAAYRELVARYHPDKHRGNPLEDLARAKLVEINRAYDILSDDAKRAAYEAARPQSDRAGSPSPESRRPRTAETKSAVNRPGTPPDVARRVVRSLGLLLTLLFFLKFGVAVGREILLVVRGIVIGLLWIMRASPVLAVAVVVALALFAGLFVRSRKGSGS
jgi:curved DNA-binding protein CbpA